MSTSGWCGTIAAWIVLLATGAGCAPANPGDSLVVRVPRDGEVPLEAGTDAEESADANIAVGPDSTRVFVRTDAQFHPSLWISDSQNGTTSLLIDDRASFPHWSPDGRYLGCVVWKSVRQYGELVVVDVQQRAKILDPEIPASVANMKWSPDSRTLAAAGAIYARPAALLYAITVPEGNVTALDTLNVLLDYEFSWHPDGRRILYSRPTAVDSIGEEPVAADLWIFDLRTQVKTRLIDSPDWVESDPAWVSDSTFQFNRRRWDGANLGPEQRMIGELPGHGGDGDR